MNLLQWLLDTRDYPPRWYCGHWSSEMGWLHILSDIAIFAAYFMIPCLLVFFIRKRRDVPMTPVFWLFAAFILSCGIGHLIEACIFWHPVYRLAGVVKLMTAVVSLATVVVLARLIPLALTLPGLAKLNQQLEAEIVERKKTEAALQMSLDDVASARAMLEQRNIELGLTNDKLRDANQAAEAATRAKSEFLANMSHEIRTPMTAILGYAEILDSEMRSAEDRESLDTIRRNGQYLLELINDILDLSKIEAGRLEMEYLAFSPLQLVADVAALMRVRADAKGLPLVVQYRGALPPQIHSDPTRLRQCLVNLLGNAIKFTEVGEVRMIVSVVDAKGETPQGPRLMFEVIDSGIGMSEQEVARLFRPFTQSDSSTARRFGGTGLGLTITKRLAEMLGGEIAVTSCPGEGSTFRLTIAAGEMSASRTFDSGSEAMWREPLAYDSSADAQPLIGCRVLLAEDGPDNQRLLAALLRMAGATVSVVDNGKQAVTSAQGDPNPFDVILMDMQMPVLDGYSATRELRGLGYEGPIVALTAHAMTGDREKCLLAGCSDYASKPIERGRLIELIRRHWQQGVAAPTVASNA